MPDIFADYARVAFKHFGDQVKFWITINEPRITCMLGYDNEFAPAYNSTGVGDYLCGHHILLAHAKAYHIYDREFRQAQQGMCHY